MCVGAVVIDVQPRWFHHAKWDEFLDLVDVHSTPHTFYFARGKPDIIALIVNGFSDAVDPAKTKSDID